MVRRAILTETFVDEVEPPSKGEQWIADTKIRGFGLRVWRNKDGRCGKAYCVRSIDADGRMRRYTLKLESLFLYKVLFRQASFESEKVRLGAFIEEARDWARDVLDELKGHRTLAEEEEEQREAYVSSASSRTLERMANVILNGHLVNGASREYVDRLDKLFALNVPDNLKGMPVSQISHEQLVSFLLFKDIPPGNVRLLRPFLRKIFELDRVLSRKGAVFDWALGDAQRFAGTANSLESVLQDWTRDDLEGFFKSLEDEPTYWQQAICLYLYFGSSQAPLDGLMRARWSQLIEVDFYWKHYPNRGPMKRAIIEFSRKSRHHMAVTRDQVRVLEKLRKQVRSHFGDNEYLFPSCQTKGERPIRSVEHVWRNILHDHSLPYLSPRQFRLQLNGIALSLREFSDEHRLFNPETDNWPD